MNEQDTQTVERVAKAINGPHDSSHIGIEELHKMQEYRWKRQTTKPERERCLNQARAAISAMPDTTAQADTVTPQQAAKVLLEIMPNPLFDNLKYPLMGEFSQTTLFANDDGDEDSMEVTIDWTVTKDIIAAALRAIAGEPQ